MRTFLSPHPISILSGLLAFAPLGSAAQPTNSGQVPTRDEVVALSPFEVNTSRDTSYGALNSTSISAFNMDLLKTPVAADVMTAEFMRDMAVTNVEDLLRGYGAGFGELILSSDGAAEGGQAGDRAVNTFGSRGVTAGQPRRDGFSTSTTNAGFTDAFDTERVEVIKGANALLFGASGAGGFVSMGSKQARFGSDRQPLSLATISLRNDQYGSRRWTLDANYGVKDVAFRLVVLNDEQKYRRLFVGYNTDSFFATLSARLPFNTIVRLSGRKVDNDRILNQAGGNIGNLSFTNATRDPRHNFALPYLLATNQAGAINPKTGAAFPAGAVLNGGLTWQNTSSLAGSATAEDNTSELYTLTAESVWTKWLSTAIGGMYDFSKNNRWSGGSVVAPRAFNNANPYDDWAYTSTFTTDHNNTANAGRRHSYRANAVVTAELLNGRARTQTVLGYELNFRSLVPAATLVYYEADGNFRVYDRDNPRPAAMGGTTGANQLGRIAMPTYYWPIGGGPVKHPFFRMGSEQIAVNGRNYVLLQQNPRNPNFVSALNPLGLVSLVPGFTGVGGTNWGPDGRTHGKDYGLYGANYTRWFDDRFTTLAGFRLTETYRRTPNAALTGTSASAEYKKSSPSYNLGLNYRFKPWLYGYYNAGRTYSPPSDSVGGDYLGNPPKDTIGLSQEIGFKYEPAGARISGSISYYFAKSKDEIMSVGTAARDLVNPAGINDAFNAALRNIWLNLDKESRGLEVILTAAPTKNWRARLGFTQQDGRMRTSAAYAMLWNDEFYYNKQTGGVTYADGAPFLVPTDAASIALVNAASTLRAPVAGATNTQLTIAMMSDRNSPYYAYGQGGNVEPNGRITSNSTVFRALRWFQIPSGGQNIQARTLRTGLPAAEIPYAYGDPYGYKGVAAVAKANEPTVGQPLYRFVFTNTYDVTGGWFRGISLGATVRCDFDKPSYWYNEPDGKGGTTRKLFKSADVNPQVSPFLAYVKRFGRREFRAQLNVNNIFNRYTVQVTPSPATGFTVEDALYATFVGEPRQYVWTNTISF